MGKVFNPANGTFDFALARYNKDGTLDDSFGGFDNNVPGTVITNFGDTDDFANGAAAAPDGKIIAVGRPVPPAP